MQKGRAATTLSAMSTPPLLLLLYDADVLQRFLPLCCEALPGVTCSHSEALSGQLCADTAGPASCECIEQLPALPAASGGSGSLREEGWSCPADEVLC